MFLFPFCLAIAGLFATSEAFLFFTESHDVFHKQRTPQTQTPDDRTLLDRMKRFPLSLQLLKNNDFGAASTNDSCAGPAYTQVRYLNWKANKQVCLESCQMLTRAGMPSNMFDFFKE